MKSLYSPVSPSPQRRPRTPLRRLALTLAGLLSVSGVALAATPVAQAAGTTGTQTSVPKTAGKGVGTGQWGVCQGPLVSARRWT